MKYRFAFISLVLASALMNALSPASAQEVSAITPSGTADFQHEILRFSEGGQYLREIVSIRLERTNQLSHVRAVTYAAATGEIGHVWDLHPGTWCSSATANGQTAVIALDGNQPESRVRLFLFDTQTGRAQDIPSSWYDADDHRPYAAISGDGRLVSVYSESGPADGPVVVKVYNWRTKRLVAKQATGFPAGGASWGGVTVDGKIEFLNSRSGGHLVDPKTGRLIVSVESNSYRSLDGAWDAEFPNWYANAPLEAIIKDGKSGKAVGKLDLQMTDDNQEKWASGRGAFCGTTGRFVAANLDTLQVFEIPSGKQIADFPSERWRVADGVNIDRTVSVACSSTGKRVAIRSGERLTLHDLN